MLKKFTEVGSVWYENKDYNDNDVYNFSAFRCGEAHIGGSQIAGVNSRFFKTPKKVEVITSELKEDVVLTYNDGVEVTEHFEFFENCGTVRQYNTIKNNGTKIMKLTRFSSTDVNINCSGIFNWYDEKRFVVHYCRSSWCAEGQWKSSSLKSFGMGEYSSDLMISAATFRSEGSWSTGKYYPLIILEDLEKGCCYYFENECSNNWEIELTKKIDCLGVNINSCNNNHDGWFVELKPGEEYSTTAAFYGKVYGGFEKAVRDLSVYKRNNADVKWKDGHAPLVYNNFMGATWLSPDARLIDLINKSAELGCEVFCIDDGWFKPKYETEADIGDYIADDERFSPFSFGEIIAYIKSKEMIPGVWFELEACTDSCKGYSIKNGICRRNGEILNGPRAFYDMTNSEVKEHLLKAVDRVYKLGVRYIKNDYNNSTGIGIGDSDYNENAKKQMRAALSFIREIQERYPDMIIENCGSGAMRSDNMILSQCRLQSISDQERYYNNPSILMGSLVNMPAEKAGVWTYPYFESTRKLDSDEQTIKEVMQKNIERNKNGEETIFNMVTGNMGAMYMSGRIDWADKYNTALILEGVELYKANRDFISNAYPVYPMGIMSICESGFTALGLTDAGMTRLLLAVWKINCSSDRVMIDLSKYTDKTAKIKMIYPVKDKACHYCFSPETGRLSVKLSGDKNMARLFEIEAGFR